MVVMAIVTVIVIAIAIVMDPIVIHLEGAPAIQDRLGVMESDMADPTIGLIQMNMVSRQ